MPALMVVALLAVAPQRLAVVGFTKANVEESVAEVAADHFARQLGQQGFAVTTSKDLAAVIGIERQKQLLGCADYDGSCLAELSNALGVDGIVSGSLGRFGSRYTVNIKVTAARDGASLAVFSAEVGSEDELPAALSRAASEISGQLRPARPLPTGHRIRIGVGYGAAAVLLVGAGVCFGLSADKKAQLENPSTMLGAAAAFDAARTGNLQQTVGFVLLGTGLAAAFITGVVFMAFGERVSVSAGPSGVAAWGTF